MPPKTSVQQISGRDDLMWHVRSIRLCQLLSVFCIAATEVPAQKADASRAYASTTLRLRADSSSSAEILAIMPSGAPINVLWCGIRWCKVAFHSRIGFVSKQFLVISPPAQPLYTGSGYTNSQGTWVPSPTRTTTGKPPGGATAQCRDGTYSFSRSRRGTCSHHGGVARWL